MPALKVSVRGEHVDESPEGCGRCAAAAGAGVGAWLMALGLVWAVRVAPGELATYVGLAAASLMLATVASWLAPRRRWLAAAPPLLGLQLGVSLVWIALAAVAPVRASPVVESAIVGIAVGLLAVGLSGVALRSGPPWVPAAIAGALTVVCVVGAKGYGSGLLASAQRVGAARIEELLRRDVLAHSGSIAWETPRWEAWSPGNAQVHLHGTMSDPPISISSGFFDYPKDAKGNSLEGLNLSLTLRLTGLTLTQSERFVTPQKLVRAGVSPQLAARFHRPTQQYDSFCDLVCDHHGIHYQANAWNVGGTKYNIRLRSFGTYSAKGP